MNVTSLFERGAVAGAGFHAGGTRCTGEELLARVASACRALANLGVRERDRVLILPRNSIESLEVVLAVMALGATAIPVNSNIGSDGVRQILGNMQPAFCVSEEPLSRELGIAIRASCKRVVIIRPSAEALRAGDVDYLAMRARYTEAWSCCAVEPERVALILHTSGSTGAPKSIVRTHRQLAAFVAYNHLLFGQYDFESAARCTPSPLIATLPISHMGGLGYCLEGLYSGRPVHLLKDFDARTVLRIVEQEKCALLLLVPSLYELLLFELGHTPQLDLSSLRFCLHGGEACPDALVSRMERGLGARAVSVYGLTECLPGIGHRREMLMAGTVRRQSCGTHLFGEITLVDEHGNRNVEQGELWVRNDTIPRRAAEDPSAGRVTEDGWFRTGDLMYRDEDGHFYWRGRVDEMFVCNGNNIYPAQIEQVLLRHPRVESACIAPVRNTRGHTIAAAMVRCKQPLTETELIGFVREHAPRHAVPAFIEFVQSLPVALSGKLDRLRIVRELQLSYERARVSPSVKGNRHERNDDQHT